MTSQTQTFEKLNKVASYPCTRIKAKAKELVDMVAEEIFVNSAASPLTPPARCILLSNRFKDQTLTWKAAKITRFFEDRARIVFDEPLVVGEDIELEYAQKFPKSKQIIAVKARVEKVHPSQFRKNLFECELYFLNKRIRFERQRSVLLGISDLHCSILDRLTICCAGQAAVSLEECKDAYRMLYNAYQVRGLCPENKTQLHYTVYNLLPETRTFLLNVKGNLSGTVSLIPDSPCGLPMEVTFPDEIYQLRQEKGRLVEIGCLTLNIHGPGRSGYSFKSFHRQAYLFKLFKTMFDYARFNLKATDVILGCQPKHEELYKYLNFERITPVKAHSGAGGVPGIVMRLNIQTAIKNTYLFNGGPGVYFLSSKVAPSENYFRWDDKTVEPFLFDMNPLWDKLSLKQKDYIRKCYPNISRPEFNLA